MEQFGGPDAFLEFGEQSRPEFRDVLRRLVELESPSTDKRAVDACGEYVCALFERIGGRVRVHRQREAGNVLQIDFASRSKRTRVMLLGHIDTVWDLGAIERMPWREKSGRLYGPGIYDMKFGIVQAVFALRALARMGGIPRPVTVLLAPDEETGSRVSRPITEKLARRCGAVLVLEPSAGESGACKTSRKGVGNYLLRVRGQASHAGLDFEKGASAILELSHQIARVAALSDLRRGLTVNPGVIRGGTRTNVVAGFAEAELDVRVTSAAQARRVERKLKALRPVDGRCSIEVSGSINRMPFEQNGATAGLFKTARKVASELGFTLGEVSAGGGSDGNFTAALGIPTLDGLGAVGDGAHAAHEHVVEAEIPRRIALLARLIECV